MIAGHINISIKMATKVTKTTTTTEDPEVLQRARGFWEKYSRPIIIAGSVIILAIAGWYGYRELIVKPKEKKANELIYAAESIFDKMATVNGFSRDSAAIVINGSKELGVTGVLKISSEYSGTKSADRAEYIAGATYLHIKEFNKAIEHLKKFDGNGAHQVKSKAYIMLGHAYAELNKTEDALSNYKKAARVNAKDDITTADALFIAASYADASGNKSEAISLYNELKKDHPLYVSVKSGDVDKYLARLGILK
jgi:tetratricopeptide (TPR) repeat protein